MSFMKKLFLKIRELASKDNKKLMIYKLGDEEFSFEKSKKAKTGEFNYIVYDKQNKIVARVSAIDKKKILYINHLDVNAEYSRRNFGSFLMKMIKDCEAKNTTIELTSLPQSVDFWKKLGFKITNANKKGETIGYPILRFHKKEKIPLNKTWLKKRK